MTPEERAERKREKLSAQAVKDQMTFDQLINFVNMKYPELPESLKIGMTKRPQKFNFVKMLHPNIGEQKETFAARLIRYRAKYHLSVDEFAAIANEFGRMHGVRITRRDIANYENYNICPKIDKMTAIAEAMGVSIDYFTGYGSSNRKSKNEFIEARHRDDAQLSTSYKKELAMRKGCKIQLRSANQAAVNIAPGA